MRTEPSDEHRWLKQLVGEWIYESVCVIGPDGETMKTSGREVVRSVGDLWVMGEMTGSVPGGGEMTAFMTLGFDPVRGRFVGSWVGSPMAHMFIYEGERDAGGSVLTLGCEGPSFADPSELARYQDMIEIRSADERRLTSRVLDGDGAWHEFMSGVFRRTG